MTTLQLIFYQAHEIARREMACDAGRRYYGTYRAAFSDALRIIYSERGRDHDHDLTDAVRRAADARYGFSPSYVEWPE